MKNTSGSPQPTLSQRADLAEAFPSRYPRSTVLCQLQPLRVCLHDNKGDISQCVKQVALFEMTCSKKFHYVHDKEGLDEMVASAFYGREEFQPR